MACPEATAQTLTKCLTRHLKPLRRTICGLMLGAEMPQLMWIPTPKQPTFTLPAEQPQLSKERTGERRLPLEAYDAADLVTLCAEEDS